MKKNSLTLLLLLISIVCSAQEDRASAMIKALRAEVDPVFDNVRVINNQPITLRINRPSVRGLDSELLNVNITRVARQFFVIDVYDITPSNTPAESIPFHTASFNTYKPKHYKQAMKLFESKGINDPLGILNNN